MSLDEYTDITRLILDLEREGKVTRTFRRLDSERQMAVLRAIFDEAVESGPEAINIKRVAERAGVAVGSLYQYFGSREGLLDFVIELTVRATIEGFDQYRDMLAALPLREALSAYITGGLEWGEAVQGFVRFFVRAAYGGDPLLKERVVRPIAEAMYGMLRAILDAALARGEIRADVDMEGTSRALNAMINTLGDSLMLPYLGVYFQTTLPDGSTERTLTAGIEIVLRGIEARPE